MYPPVVVRAPRTASLSEEDRQQAATALMVMIERWWLARGSGGRVDDGSDRPGGAAAGCQR